MNTLSSPAARSPPAASLSDAANVLAWTAGILLVTVGILDFLIRLRDPGALGERDGAQLRPGEILDHVVVFNERHLRRLLREYVAYYHDDRTHLGLGKATPAGRPVTRRQDGRAEVVALPRLGGLHHRYDWRTAA